MPRRKIVRDDAPSCMLEKVTRAIIKTRWPAINDKKLWGNFIGEGRAAIEAMREPTADMIDAFSNELSNGYLGGSKVGLSRDRLIACHHAMIDAAIIVPENKPIAIEDIITPIWPLRKKTKAKDSADHSA